jgi:uncharacterized protein (TIRG00374 family)
MKLPALLRQLVKPAVAVILLALVVASVDVARLKANLARISLPEAALLLLAHWATQLVTAQRWRVLASSFGIAGSWWWFVRIQFVGMFFSVGLPSLVGGDVVKAYAVSRKSERPFELGLASVLQDRAAGLVVLLGYGTVAAFARPLWWHGLPVAAAYAALWPALALLALLVWKGDRLYARWMARGPETVAVRMLRKFAAFHKALAGMRLAPVAALWVAVLSAANSAVVICIVFLMCRAAGSPVPLGPLCALVPLIDTLSMLPVSFSGLGLREWAYMQGLPLLGVAPEAALAIALSLSALLIVRNLTGAVFLPGIRGIRD